jgi:hypothetical protein
MQRNSDALNSAALVTRCTQAEADSISALKDAVKDVGVRATDYLTAIQACSPFLSLHLLNRLPL